MKKINLKRIGMAVFSAILLWSMASCNKIDFSKIVTDQPYIGLLDGSDCVVVFSQIEDGQVKGKAYLYDTGCFADPQPFTCELKKNGKGQLWQSSKDWQLDMETKDDKLVGKFSGEDGSHSFSLRWVEQDEASFVAQYQDAIYDVNNEPVVYAKHVKGYWSYYSDTREDFGTIYTNKLKDLVLSQDLELDMDVYYPKDDLGQRPRPLLLLIHGGAFYNGDKASTGYPEMAQHFASRGYTVASINYRLGFWPLSQSVDRAGYRAVQDAHAAVRYLVDHAEEFRIDTSNIFVAGTSAGAITALNLAFMREHNRPDASREVTGEWLRDIAHDILKIGEWVIDQSAQLLKKAIELVGIDTSESAIMQRLDGIDFNGLSESLGLDYDLGSIESVNPECQPSFKIKAVVNMWGAVHDLSMLNNSNQTAILSFHGDADRIVPYGCDYPFREVLDPYTDAILGAISFQNPQIKSFLNTLLLGGKPINEVAFRKMYGSKAISDKADALGMRSELCTVPNGDHSLHVDDDGQLSDYFWKVILPKTTDFLYGTMVGERVALSASSEVGRYVVGGTSDVAELHWKAIGGVVTSATYGHANVLFFNDAQEHGVVVCGKYENGVEFRETWKEE